jgi:hypothetical protein
METRKVHLRILQSKRTIPKGVYRNVPKVTVSCG